MRPTRRASLALAAHAGSLWPADSCRYLACAVACRFGLESVSPFFAPLPTVPGPGKLRRKRVAAERALPLDLRNRGNRSNRTPALFWLHGRGAFRLRAHHHAAQELQNTPGLQLNFQSALGEAHGGYR